MENPETLATVGYSHSLPHKIRQIDILIQ